MTKETGKGEKRDEGKKDRGRRGTGGVRLVGAKLGDKGYFPKRWGSGKTWGK